MHDPHVVALYYRIESASDTYNLGQAQPCDVNIEGFTGHIENCRLELRPLDHFASAESAHAAAVPLLRAWELMELLQQRRPVFRFRPDGAKVVERSPAPPPEPAPPPRLPARGEPQALLGNSISVPITVRGGSLILGYRSYPKPPAACPPLLQVLLDRIDAYYKRSTREFLTSAGYFVLSRLEEEHGGKRAEVAAALNVDLAVLNGLGRLASSHDPKVGRKGRSKGGPASMADSDLDIVERIMNRLVRRVGEATAVPAASLPRISLANLG